MLSEPAYYDKFAIRQNAKFEWTVKLFVKGEDGLEAVSLDGFQARLMVRSNVDSDTTLLDMSTANGRIVITDDEMLLSLSSEEVNELTAWEDPGVYDLRLTPAGQDAFYLLCGPMPYVKSVTR